MAELEPKTTYAQKAGGISNDWERLRVTSRVFCGRPSTIALTIRPVVRSRLVVSSVFAFLCHGCTSTCEVVLQSRRHEFGVAGSPYAGHLNRGVWSPYTCYARNDELMERYCWMVCPGQYCRGFIFPGKGVGPGFSSGQFISVFTCVGLANLFCDK